MSAPSELTTEVFESTDLLGEIARHAEQRHLVDLASLLAVSKATRKILAPRMEPIKRSLRLFNFGGVARNYSYYQAQGRILVHPNAELRPDCVPGVMLNVKEQPQVRSLNTHRSTWKGRDVVRFLDLFYRQHPERILAWNMDFMPPEELRPAEWREVRAHPAVQSGLVRLVDSDSIPIFYSSSKLWIPQTCYIETVMAYHIRKARQARARRRVRQLRGLLGF